MVHGPSWLQKASARSIVACCCVLRHAARASVSAWNSWASETLTALWNSFPRTSPLFLYQEIGTYLVQKLQKQKKVTCLAIGETQTPHKSQNSTTGSIFITLLSFPMQCDKAFWSWDSFSVGWRDQVFSREMYVPSNRECAENELSMIILLMMPYRPIQDMMVMVKTTFRIAMISANYGICCKDGDCHRGLCFSVPKITANDIISRKTSLRSENDAFLSLFPVTDILLVRVLCKLGGLPDFLVSCHVLVII